MSKYQFLPSLSLDEYEALRESIQKYGVIQPVVVDEDGAIIDGYHRVKICKELGIDYPKRILKKLTEEEKENLSVSLNIKRRHLTKDQKKELALALREEGWTQERIASVMEVSQKTISNWISNFSNPDLHSPNLNQDELITLKLRLESEGKKAVDLENENDRLRKEQLAEIDAKVKARTDAMKEEYQRRFDEAVTKVKAANKPADEIDMAVIDKMVEQRTAEKVAELEEAKKKADASRAFHDKQWKHLQEVREKDKKILQARLDEKTEEIEEAARKHLDLKKLQAEYDELARKKRHLENEMKASAIVARIRKTLLSENEAFSRGMIVLQLLSKEILTRDDCAGLTLEELERFRAEALEATVCGKKIVAAIHEVIEKVRGGGALRVVQGD